MEENDIQRFRALARLRISQIANEDLSIRRWLGDLVGERGPEVFTRDERGRIASNREIARLTDPSAVAGLRKGGADVSVMHTRGDTHYSPSFVIHGARNPEETKRQVESHFWDLVRQAERDQAGSLSD